MEVGETAGESPPSASEPTAQNPPAPATTNRSSPEPARPITADVEHKPTNGEPRSLGVTKGADISGDSGIRAGDGEGSGGGGGGFASLARKLTSKGKGVAKPPGDAAVGVASEKQQNGCPDDLDLPLGSEAYSISSLQVNGIDSTSRISVGPDAVSSQKSAAQSGMMGWQSFNSDVSTSAASTASLDMLLNDRLVDPEEVLFNLGFGGPQPVAYVPSLARIPQRFLQAAASRAAAGDDGTGDALPGLGGFSSPEDGPGSAGGGGGGGGSGGLAAAVQAMQQQGAAGGQMGRKRTAFQTLARTVSLMRGIGGGSALARATQRRSPVFGHHSGSAAHSPAGTPPHGPGAGRDLDGVGGGPINSILSPVNQRYLASKGYYRQQGWPRGTYIEPEEEAQINAIAEESRTDATSRRKMFQKTRSQRQNWSMCESGEKENGAFGDNVDGVSGEGEGGDKPRTGSSGGRGEWLTKSMDDSLSQDEGVRARIDSVGQNTFFSTTTEESSTDSLDLAGSETERALEEIRRQYHESQKVERKQSEELFLPRRRSDKKATFGDLLESPGVGVFQEEDSEENAENPGPKKGGHHRSAAMDLSGPNRIRISSDGDDEGTGGSLLIPDDSNRSNNYFISPVSSRQTTVEKSPTMYGSNDDDFPQIGNSSSSSNNNDNNNNNNEGDPNNKILEDNETMVESNNKVNLEAHRDRQDSGGGEVKIIVSSFSSGASMGSSWSSSRGSPSPGPDTSKANSVANPRSNNSNNNKLTVERAQQASSDSGSSSSGGTAVGVAVSTDHDTDGPTPRNFLSEESDGITDRDSISRTHSPCGFPPSRPNSGGMRDRSGIHGPPTLTTSCCQTSDADFIMATQAENGEAVNATVRRSSPAGENAFALRGRSLSNMRSGAISPVPKRGDSLSTGLESKDTGRDGETVDENMGDNKYRLSALPTNINPLELMKRLRHSQDELLRTGSVQSDSSGFGDADPTPDSAHSEADQPKLSSLGSSHESGDTTLAGSSGSQLQHKLHLQHTQAQAHLNRGEMATQTPRHSSQYSTRIEDEDKGDKNSPLPGGDNSSFITTCFIPSLTPREGQTSDGLRHRRGNQQNPAPSRSYLHLQQQQQQPYALPHQQQHYSDPSNGSHKTEALFYVPHDAAAYTPPPSFHPLHSAPYPHHTYKQPMGVHPPGNSPYHPGRGFHEPPDPYNYPDYDYSDPSFYHRRYSNSSRSYRSAMSDSEWSGYPDRDYFGQSYVYDYNYNYAPPPHGRFLQRHRSLDNTGFVTDYTDYTDYSPNGDADQENLDSQAALRPRKYRSQLELFTTGKGKVTTGSTTFLQRSQSEEGGGADRPDGNEKITPGFGRNQKPLSEELAAALGGNSPSRDGELELDSSMSKDESLSLTALKTPTKTTQSQSQMTFTSSKTIFPAKSLEVKPNTSHIKPGQGMVSSIFIPTSPSLTLTPATPEVSKYASDVSVSATSPESIHLPHATPVSVQGSGHISGQNLPALAGNLRSLPQGQHSTPLDQQLSHKSMITINTSSGNPTTGQISNPVTFTTSGIPKTFSLSSSASASAFKSRKPKSCDILDDDDDIEFSTGVQPLSSEANFGSNPPTSSASFVSRVYVESKGRGGEAKSDGPLLNAEVPSPHTINSRPLSHHSGSLPGSPSLHHRYPGGPLLPSPSRQHPPYHRYPPPPPPYRHHRSYSSSSSSLPPMPFSQSQPHPLSYSRGSDDMDGYFSSSMAESSSDLSFRSTPEWGGRSGILNSRKLARLINQPVYFKGHRRPGCNYRPRRLFKEWAMLSKRKRLQEENRLLQHTLHKYKTELNIMESALKIDFQAAVPDMTQEERDQVSHVEWLWSQVKTEVAEMERLLISRIKSVQSGNDFHSLLTNMGVISKITELLKEQVYQQQVISSRGTEADDEDDNESLNNEDEIEDTPDDLEILEEDVEHGSRHSDAFWDWRNRSYHGLPHHPRPSLSWMAGVGPASTPRLRSQGSSSPGSKGRPHSASSTSNLQEDLNISLEQMKSSLLSQMHQEIKDSTRKLELDLQAKDKEIQALKHQVGSVSARSTPDLTHRTVFKFNTSDRSSRSSTPQSQGSSPVKKRSRSRSRMMGDRIVQETDV